jgi:hypothetical protein
MPVRPFGDVATSRTGEVKNEVGQVKKTIINSKTTMQKITMARSPNDGCSRNCSSRESRRVGVHVSASGAYSQASGPWI